MNVTRTQEFRDRIRKHQLLKGDMWELYKFRKRFNPEMYKDVDLNFWTFKREAAKFFKDPALCEYKELFLELQNALVTIRGIDSYTLNE